MTLYLLYKLIFHICKFLFGYDFMLVLNFYSGLLLLPAIEQLFGNDSLGKDQSSKSLLCKRVKIVSKLECVLVGMGLLKDVGISSFGVYYNFIVFASILHNDAHSLPTTKGNQINKFEYYLLLLKFKLDKVLCFLDEAVSD
jgi:hypothetical protein